MFNQVLNPTGNLGLTVLAALIPVIVLLVLLAVFRVTAWLATLIGSILTLIIAVQPTSRSPHHGATSPLLHYVHSGRLVADLRTAAAMVEFILEPVPPDLPVTSPAHAG